MDKVKTRIIIEMLGAPKEHIQETLEMYVNKIKNDEKNIVMNNVEYAEPKESGKMFSVFAELDLDFTDISSLVWFCFDYMPSSIEIFEPEELRYERAAFTDFINDLQARLHKFDMIIKNLSAENKVAKKNGLTLAKNIVLVSLEAGPKTIDEMSTVCGLPVASLQKFIDILVKDNKIVEKDGKYSLPK